MKSSSQASSTLRAATQDAIQQVSSALLGRQWRDGYWWADLTADTTLESDYILTQLWLYPPANGVWNPPTRPQIERAVSAILSRQLDDGGFNIYLHGPSEVSASIKAYVGLKLGGVPQNDPRMKRLRGRILELGGMQAANSYVRINLSLFGLYPREACPTIPPEVALLPFNFIYQMSSWTRAIVMALAIVHAANPNRPVPAGFTVDELFLSGAPTRPQPDITFFSWRNSFLWFDRALKVWERIAPTIIRQHAIRKCAEWMIDRFEGSDGLGAIYPSMQYSIMALGCSGVRPRTSAATPGRSRIRQADGRR